jgi:hypothetical protein
MTRRLLALPLAAAALFAAPAAAEPNVCLPALAGDVCVTVIECARVCMWNPGAEVECTPDNLFTGICYTVTRIIPTAR